MACAAGGRSPSRCDHVRPTCVRTGASVVPAVRSVSQRPSGAAEKYANVTRDRSSPNSTGHPDPRGACARTRQPAGCGSRAPASWRAAATATASPTRHAGAIRAGLATDARGAPATISGDCRGRQDQLAARQRVGVRVWPGYGAGRHPAARRALGPDHAGHPIGTFRAFRGGRHYPGSAAPPGIRVGSGIAAARARTAPVVPPPGGGR